MKYLASLVALAVGLLVGCSKQTSVEKPKAETPAKTLNLGSIEVADRVKMLFDLGEGKTCRITPTFLKEGTVLLEMVVEENGHILSRPRVQAPFGMPVSMSVGDTAITFTARKKQ